jgi:prepilin-type N-terminal cleavage/methylation domain-containing protein
MKCSSQSISASQRLVARGRRRSGFTLIEVLGTILLLGIVVPAAMEAVTIAMTAASVVRHRTEAAGLAESKLTDLVVTGEWQEGVLSGDFAPDWPEYRWEAVVDNWDQANVQMLQLKVAWQRAGVEDSISVSTLVYLNNASNPLGGTGGAVP